ncbi:hypothetical protein BACCAP_02412 [Pseudoflavonifractor capillosus ATCC 29799]|uniref:Uncharacterized protein n=1 Tax=Pseudoflavonifractor capillosus ATCC 29799 TaxID=411467 RepID=A6NW19_9FIRM|nr:hypothetical protein BACCAP_02412 [Pseudoflavonifractor capillosus ATCC 29799]
MIFRLRRSAAPGQLIFCYYTMPVKPAQGRPGSFHFTRTERM